MIGTTKNEVGTTMRRYSIRARQHCSHSDGLNVVVASKLPAAAARRGKRSDGDPSQSVRESARLMVA